MAGVPELGGGADHVGLGVHQNVLHQRIGFQFGATGLLCVESKQFKRALLAFPERLHLRPSALHAALFQDGRLLLLGRFHLIEEPSRGKAQRGGRFAGGPNVHQPVQRILALLNALLVTDGAGSCALCSAKALALVADDRLDGGEQLGSRHQAHAHASALEDRIEDFAVAVVGNDDAVLDGVAANDAAGRNLEVEDGVAGRGELVNQLFRRSAMVEDALVGLFQDYEATALDARIV